MATPRTSSIATKTETPLLETPRSVSIVDRQTLDDAVVNITQAHDRTVGMTPQDERGPGFARGFPVDFYEPLPSSSRTSPTSATCGRVRVPCSSPGRRGGLAFEMTSSF